MATLNIPRRVGRPRCAWRACHVQRQNPTLRGMPTLVEIGMPTLVEGALGLGHVH